MEQEAIRKFIHSSGHTGRRMRWPWKGDGPLHLDHNSIWVLSGPSLELSQLRDARSYVKRISVFLRSAKRTSSKFELRSLAQGELCFGLDQVNSGEDSAPINQLIRAPRRSWRSRSPRLQHQQFQSQEFNHSTGKVQKDKNTVCRENIEENSIENEFITTATGVNGLPGVAEHGMARPARLPAQRCRSRWQKADLPANHPFLIALQPINKALGRDSERRELTGDGDQYFSDILPVRYHATQYLMLED
jgi:hypothetical protein